MVIPYTDVLSLILTLGEVQGLKASAAGSTWGACLAGIIAAAFSFILGPIGLAIGGAVGGLVAYWWKKGTFKPLHTVIQSELTQEQRDDLICKVRDIVGNLEYKDGLELVALVTANGLLKSQVLKVIKDYVFDCVKMKME